MEPTDLIMFFLLANFFFSPITIIGNQYNQGLLAMAGAERIFWLIDMPPDWEDDPAAADLPDPRKAAPASRTGARVEFRGVSFGYDPARLVLHDINFMAEPGQTVALVGHTGSGKSSIINLVVQVLPADRGRGPRRRPRDPRDHRPFAPPPDGHGAAAELPLQRHGPGEHPPQPARGDRGRGQGGRRAGSAASTSWTSCRTGCDTQVGRARRGAFGRPAAAGLLHAARCSPTRGSSILDEATSSIDALTEARLQQALVDAAARAARASSSRTG